MKKIILESRAFSLIETIIAVFVLSLILLILGAIYANYARTYGYQSAQTEIANAARAVMPEIQSYVLQASEIAENHDFSGTTYMSDESTLVLKLPSIDASDDVVDGSFDYVVFRLAGAELTREIDADASSSRLSNSKQLSNIVSSLTFTYDNADLEEATSVGAELEAESTTKGKTVSFQTEETIYLRNK